MFWLRSGKITILAIQTEFTMKKTLLFLMLFAFISSVAVAQVTAGQIDDFESDTTTQGWFEGGASPNPPVHVSTGGPTGSGDAYISAESGGGGGPGSRQVIRNVSQWAGDFTSQGIIAIRMTARAVGNDLNLRIAMDGDGGRIVSSSAIVVTMGSGWTNVEIPISAANMQTAGGFDVNATLANASEMRILSAVSPTYQGDAQTGFMELDNIEAATTLSVDDVVINDDFKISPNPSASDLNLALNRLTGDTIVEVYDILGKRIHIQSISSLNTRIDANQWSNGVYLVKISNDVGTQTKRFVKQ